MPNFKKEFNLYDEKMLERKALTMKYFTDDILICKKSIGFQMSLNNFVADIVNKLKIEESKDSKNTDIMQFALATQIFILNSKRLYNAYELAFTDSSESNYNLLRVTFESILFSFYLYNHPTDANEINEFFNERFSDIDTPSKKRKDRSSEELKVIERKEKYTPKNIRDSLFVGKQRESIQKIYAVLSTQSHVNVETINGSHYSYTKNRVKDMFWYVKLLSFYNIISFLDNLPETQNIVDRIINKDILNFINELNSGSSVNGNMGDFFPNHPNVKKSRLFEKCSK